MKQLNLSLKKTSKRKDTATTPTSKRRSHVTGEVCFRNYLRPAGITNAANNCYASSVLHCLLNHPVFPTLNEVIAMHKGFCNSTCSRTGMWDFVIVYSY